MIRSKSFFICQHFYHKIFTPLFFFLTFSEVYYRKRLKFILSLKKLPQAKPVESYFALNFGLQGEAVEGSVRKYHSSFRRSASPI
ncbi:MAG: hypothetical protein C0407_14905 [Desulfobacca sp.]|nr:hypothetical protein [Desulfobacca sp.]